MKKPGKSKLVRFYFDTVFAPARLSGTRVKSVYLYDLELRRFSKFLERPALLSDLNDETVGKALGWLRKRGGEHGGELSLASVEKFRDCICAMWRYFNQIRIVDTYPSVPKVIVPVRIPTAWSLEELRRLWKYLERLPGDVNGVPANLFFLSLLAALWDTGARIGEILPAKFDQIELTTGYFVTKAEERKGGLSDKLHKLNPETCGLLRQIVLPQRDKIWAWPWSTSILYKRWREFVKRAGLRGGREFMFHCVRKSVATYTKLGGGNPQETLGHYDASMTEQVYIDPRLCPKQHAADILPRLHEPKPKDDENVA